MDFTRFQVAIDESQIDDLQRRLARTRWPQPYDIVTWHDGSSLAFMQRLVAHWRTDFDWRLQEARLNQLPQFRATLDDLMVRLNEAKRLMMNEHLDAASAAFQVGYESPSQFSREYRCLFGEPPKRHIVGWRRQAQSHARGSSLKSQ